MRTETNMKLLKVVILLAVAAVLLAYCWVMPNMAESFAAASPECRNMKLPWMIVIGATALPMLAAAVIGLNVVTNIQGGKCFTHGNARCIKYVAILAAADGGYFFLGNIVMLLIGMSHPGVMIISLIPSVMAFSLAVAFYALSHLTEKAALMQDDTDLTI